MDYPYNYKKAKDSGLLDHPEFGGPPLLISVILSTYNHLEYLPISVGTILNQTFKEFMELIIIDDGSTDGTWDYLSDVKIRNPWVKIFKHVCNLGIQKSYREGFKLAKGNLLTFVSADNIHKPTMIEDLARPLIDNPEFVFSYSAFEWIDAEGKVFRTTLNQYLGPHALMIDNPGMACFMYRKSVVDEIGYYDPEIGPAMDTDYWLRISERYGLKRMAYVPRILCQFRFDQKCKSYDDLMSDRIRGSIKKMVDKAVVRRKLNRKTKSPRVLFIVPNFPPDWYAGIEVYTYNLSKQLIKEGWDVSVLYRQMGDPGIVESTFDSIKVYNILSNSSLVDTKLMVEDPEIERLFIKFLDGVQPFDIFHFHHTMGFPFSIINIPKKCGYPVLLTLHDFWFMCRRMYLYRASDEVCVGPKSTDYCVHCILRGQERFVDEVASAYYNLSYLNMSLKLWMKEVDLITTPSNFSMNKFREYDYRVDTSSPLGIQPLERKEPRDDREFTFGYFGVINKIKNVSLIVRAYKELSQYLNPEEKTKLLIWGSGRDEDLIELEKEIGGHEKIKFFKSYKPENLSKMLSLIDCMVSASRHETYSLTIREAMSSGVPVISSAVGGVTEIIRPDRNGLLFHPNCKVALLNEMIRIVRSKSLFEHLKNGLKKTYIPTIENDCEDWIKRYKYFIQKGERI